MLSSAKIGTSSWRYYTSSVACAASEYYLGAGEAPGRWHGRGLAELGLEPGALVGEAQLEALFARALHPGSRKKLGRAWRSDGVTGFDLTFSAPKSVSSLWALADPDTAGELRAAHADAVTAELGYLDAHASWSRRGVDGTEQVATSGLAAALFEHRTSRCADPQLHTHAVVVNKVHCADGIWRTIDATELYHHKKSAGMIYQAALRSEVLARTGLIFDTADNNGQAEITGVPAGLSKLWAKRTSQIEPEAAAKIAEYESTLGRSLTSNERAAVTKTAVLKTRPAKEHHHDAGTLREPWVSEATGAGYDPGQVVETARESARQACRQAPGQAPRQAVETDLAVTAGAVQAAAATRAVFSRADVTGQVAARMLVDGRSAAGVLALVEQYTDRALGLPEAVPVGEHPTGRTPRASDARWAGAEVLAAEAQVLSLAGRGRGGGYGRVQACTVIVALDDAGLDLTQYQAIEALACGGDFLSVLTAPAGAGKTRTLGVAASAWQRGGYRVIGLAPSARAAGELAAATGGPPDTLAKWILDNNRRGLLPADARGRVVLDARTVVIVDEASMANTHDLDTLVVAAARAGAKVVLVGDPAQIGVVNGPGGMLAALADAGHGVDLDTVHRFNEAWEAGASLGLRRGDPDALTAYRDQGRMHPCLGTDDAVAAVHAHWARESAAGSEVLMMARTRADVDTLNQAARATAVATGQVHGPAVRIGERDWQTGDLLRTRRNDRRLPVGEGGNVRNGDRYRVLGVDPEGLQVEHLDRGEAAFLPADYVGAHAEYGWATTITAAQGATVQVGLVLVRPGIDRDHLYVVMTRGRETNHTYVTPDPSSEADDRHGIPGVGQGNATPEERALDVLGSALARSGAQDAAHTARDHARTRSVDAARRDAEQIARQTAKPVVPAEHAARTNQLTELQVQSDRLHREQREHRFAAATARAELAGTSRLRPGHRRDLIDTITRHDGAFDASFPDAAKLDREIRTLARQVNADAREREAEQGSRTLRATRVRDRREAVLTPARDLAASGARLPRSLALAQSSEEVLRAAERSRRSTRDHAHDRGRDDGPVIGW
ncbi:MAG: MobF family relaxase [Sporichthyaceae bacterium]